MAERSFWLPLNGHLCAVDGRGTVHASVWTHSHPLGRGKRRTVPTICGYQRLRILVHDAVQADGTALGVIAAQWPPPAAKHKRCAACLSLTGRPRPHRSWRDLREAPADG